MKHFLLMALLFLGASAVPAYAQQDSLPELPAPIQNLVNDGAQIRFLGKDHGVEAWLTIKNGVEQYFYVLPGRKAFIMGVLFDDTGKLVTVEQVNRLREGGDTLLDSLAEFPAAEKTDKGQAFEFKTPSEQLYADIESGNWVPLGAPQAPVIYSFIDPQCPHCHEFINMLRKGGYLENGQVQLRMVPVGFKDETRAQAAFLIASPDPAERWYRHMDGDKTALPARSEINQQGVQKNLSIMQSWKFDVTPLSVYRDKSGTIKIIRGTPQDMKAVLADLGGKTAP
ncbi:MAG: thioredoxin fold domain-containing protein [Alphaproteobacteria bacterium]|nr:thioredoxin fold domain-containing protein [Alphaproteobacteria bacterium]